MTCTQKQVWVVVVSIAMHVCVETKIRCRYPTPGRPVRPFIPRKISTTPLRPCHKMFPKPRLHLLYTRISLIPTQGSPLLFPCHRLRPCTRQCKRTLRVPCRKTCISMLMSRRPSCQLMSRKLSKLSKKTHNEAPLSQKQQTNL